MQTGSIPFKKLAMLSAISAAGSIATTALAQDPEPTQTRETALEEIMVTAQKREESLQDTPIAISAFDNTQLEELNVTALDDLNGYIPSFQAPPFAASSASPTIFIRGMGSIDVQTTKDAAVGVYLDGVALGRVTGLSLDVADLERIEVLRGPQGTLYGRNTTAGAINYVTRKPHDKLSAKQRFTVGNFNQWASQTDLNLPITKNFFLKLDYLRTAIDGWVDNENTTLPDQVDPNMKDNQAAALALRWQATDNFTLDYAFDYSDLDYGNGYYQAVKVPQAINSGTTTPTDKRLDSALLAKGMAESDAEVKGHNLTLTWDLSAVTLKSITGFRELDSTLNQNYLDGLQFPAVTRLPSEFTQTNTVDQHQFSQEFQVIGSAFDQGVDYVAGLYYWNESATESQSSNFGTAGFPFLDSWQVDAEAESLAAYGQATWHPNILSRRLGFTFGLRYTEDEREATKRYIRTDLDFENPTPTEPSSGKEDFSNTNGNFVIDYAFTDNINSYLKYATGYRAGGFNARALPGTFEQGFDPENVQSAELGFKSSLWDQRMTLNAALYYNQFDDLQVDAFVPPVNSRTDNAGEATIQGVEIELLARLTRGLTLNGFYAYMDAEYGEYIQPGLGDVADDKKMANAPENQAQLGLEYAFAMTSFGQFTIRADYLWQDEFYSGPDPTTLNDSYGIWNARLQLIGVPLPKGEIRVALWGKNLSDEEYTVLTTDFSGGTGTIITSQFGMPRTYGIDFIYEY